MAADQENQDHYVVRVVFRGLFLARANAGADGSTPRLDVLLPDAAEPAHLIANSPDPMRTLLANVQPLREHHAVLEFFSADWDNRSALTPGLFEIDKPTKERVGMFFVRRRRLVFRGLHASSGVLPERLIAERDRYAALSDRLLVLERHPDLAFGRLAGFNSPVATDAERQSAAAATFTLGEVFSERRSRFGGSDRLWEPLAVQDFPNQIGAPNPERARAINLDLVVRFALPVTNPLLIRCPPLHPESPAVERQIILRPRDPRRGLTVWVKNRELAAVLDDSDLLPDPFELDCPDFDPVDRDHAYYLRLAARPADLKILRDVNQNASDCSSGCGGCHNGPP